MLKLLVRVSFYCTELVLLILFLAVGIMLSAIATGNGIGDADSVSVFSLDESRRAIGVAAVFAVWSGYVLSLATLIAIFRNRLVSLKHAIWIVSLYFAHAFVFLFYLRAQAVQDMVWTLIAIGLACVISATLVNFLLWRKLLASHSDAVTAN